MNFQVAGVPLEFILFAITLTAIAVWHRHSLSIALAGFASLVVFKLLATGFEQAHGWRGFTAHMAEEWVVLANLFLLLMGFALLARYFSASRIPDKLPRYLPGDWRGGVMLLAIVFVLSSFLDNIAAAIIGGTMAASVYRGRVYVGYLAAIVAAANAGGAGSVIGDTTSTMMWIEGVPASRILEAYVAAGAAFLVFAVPAALGQQRHAPLQEYSRSEVAIDWTSAGIVLAMLLAALLTNLTVNLAFPHHADRFPFLGAALWIAVLVASRWRRPAWEALPQAARGSIFLLTLVASASVLPVDRLPAVTWLSTFVLGVVSAVFDNIPLTKLALEQGGYDWGFLAYAVGFGGSMLWFGSSAGVALANDFPEARSVGAWLRHGWFVPLAYVVGFVVMLRVLGWHP